MKFKNTFKNGTKVKICYYPELEGQKGTIIGTLHDSCINSYTCFHHEWVALKLDNGITKYLRTCFVREI